MNEIHIYTDGACTGNPGPGGYGVVFVQGESEKTYAQGYKDTTNNRMELRACIVALEMVRDHLANMPVHIHTDSTYVQKGITEWVNTWRKYDFHKNVGKTQKVKNDDLWRQLDVLNSQLNVSWHWVKGHAGHHYNEMADVLATTAAKGDLIDDVRTEGGEAQSALL